MAMIKEEWQYQTLAKMWALVLKLAPIHGGQGELKKETGHSRLVGGRFNKQGNLPMRLVLGSCKVNRSAHLPTRILRAYVEDLMGFSHYTISGLSNIQVIQGHVLEYSSHCGMSRQNTYSKDKREGEEPPMAWVQVSGQQQSCPPDDLQQSRSTGKLNPRCQWESRITPTLENCSAASHK